MVELCLMSSATYPLGFFNQEQGLSRVSKEFQPLLPSHCTRPEILRSCCLQLRPPQLDNSWKSMHLFPEPKQSDRHISIASRPILVDVQDARPDSILFSFGITEQCARREKILQFLMSGMNISERERVDISLLSDLMGLHTLTIDVNPPALAPRGDGFYLNEIVYNDSQSSILYPRSEFYFQKPLLDIVAGLSPSSMITVHRDDRVLVTATGAEVKDLLSVITEFNLSKNSTRGNKQSMLVPHLARMNCAEAKSNVSGSSLKLQSATFAPVKSPEKLKRSPRKKHNRKAGMERDLYKKNYFHTCECLLSVLLDKRHGKTKLLSLTKSGPEVSQLLSQFSVGIAGTGLAVIFSVFSKVAGGRVPFCTAKLLSTGFGLGLVWLSSAVNRLRDTIVYISKNSRRLNLNEDDEMRRVGKNMNEIFFRAATLMTVVVLRFA
ncbi:uncharacterized protein LOC143852515 [Tasmannia lanceolata]|uniref:uncharacterized protein LOC143852515 n=1 Tax=Tasmannia lanceolata TaxID=3420 RepID=UPI004062B836